MENITVSFSPELVLAIAGNVVLLIWHSSRVSATMEKRFTKLETHMVHIMNKLGMAPRNDS